MHRWATWLDHRRSTVTATPRRLGCRAWRICWRRSTFSADRRRRADAGSRGRRTRHDRGGPDRPSVRHHDRAATRSPSRRRRLALARVVAEDRAHAGGDASHLRGVQRRGGGAADPRPALRRDARRHRHPRAARPRRKARPHALARGRLRRPRCAGPRPRAPPARRLRRGVQGRVDRDRWLYTAAPSGCTSGRAGGSRRSSAAEASRRSR